MNLSRLIPFGRSGTHVVVDIGSSSVKLATVNHESGAQAISATMTVPLPSGSVWNGWIRDPSVVASAIGDYVQGWRLQGAAAVTALPGRAVMIKTLELPSMEGADLETTMEFQAMELIPASLDDVFIDYHVMQESKEGKQFTVLLTAAKKELVHPYMEVLSTAGLLPRIVDIDYLALQNLCHRLHASTDDYTVCVVHVGASVTTMSITGRGVPLFTTDLETAGQFFTERIARDLGISLEEAEDLKIEQPISSGPKGLTALIRSLCEEFAHELKRAVSRFTAMNGNQRIDRLLLCGGGARLPGLESKLLEKFPSSVERYESLIGPELPPEFAVVGGLALRQP